MPPFEHLTNDFDTFKLSEKSLYCFRLCSDLHPCLSQIKVKPMFHCDAKPLALGPGIGLDPQRHNFALGIPTRWYLKTRKFALPPTPNLKFEFLPTQNPNASQWNIGCIGSSGVGACVGHVHFR